MVIARSPIHQHVLEAVKAHLERHPHYPDLHNEMALLHVKYGDCAGAEHHLKEALRLHPGYREAFLNLACLYMKDRRWQEADTLLCSKARRYGRDSFYQNLAGIASFIIGRPKQGQCQIEKAIRLDSFHQSYYRRLGVFRKGALCLSRGRTALLRKIISDHLDASYHSLMGLRLAQLGRFGEATRELGRASRLEPGACLSHIHLGFVHYLCGRYALAVQAFRKGLRIDPSYGMGHAHLSYTYGAMGHTGRALRSMQRALELNPGYADLHYNLALLYSGQKRHEEAVTEFRAALRINPNFLFARVNLGVLYEEMKRWRDAEREYRKVLQITPDDENVRGRLERILGAK